jgi:curli biogenesis system outer membrane secretion channel CsgG
MLFNQFTKIVLVVFAAASFTACSTVETSKTIVPQKVQAAYSPYSGVKVAVSIGKFENKSPFLRGIFSDGVDRLGNRNAHRFKRIHSHDHRIGGGRVPDCANSI